MDNNKNAVKVTDAEKAEERVNEVFRNMKTDIKSDLFELNMENFGGTPTGVEGTLDEEVQKEENKVVYGRK